MVKGLRVAFFKVILISLLILQLGIGAVNGADYVSKPEHVMTKFLTATVVNNGVGLELTVQLEKIVYRSGEPIKITFTLTNINNKTITLWLMADESWDYQVFNDTNNLVFDYILDWPFLGTVGLPVQIAAGANLTAVFVWPQAYGEIPLGYILRYINGTSPFGGAFTPVSPGTYYIVGQFSNGTSSTFTLQTSPLQIIIGHALHRQMPYSCRNLHPLDTMAKPNLTNGRSRHPHAVLIEKNRR